MKTADYSKHYSDGSLARKLTGFAAVAGGKLVEKVLVLFYALKDRDTPKWAKSVILGALGYFILPLDAVPDFVPFAGYADDFGALATALGVVAFHVKKEHTDAARRSLRRWLGERNQEAVSPS